MTTAALYIHYPFCRKKCNYCDFYSTTLLARQDVYVQALLKEIELYADDERFQNLPFSTVYFGGGTPSLLSSVNLSKILQKLYKHFNIDVDAEISIEANPGTIVDDRLFDFYQMGVNRITFGVQSFLDEELATLSRIHSVNQALHSIGHARNAGFANIGLDLIFGIPGQSMHSLEKSLQQAVDLDVRHLSVYGLTYEKDTPLYRMLDAAKIQPAEEETEREMFLFVHDFLQNAGYEHYEISNYAYPGDRSHHNQKYWDGSDYLGFGPGAHSRSGNLRWWNIADLENYIKRINHSQSVLEMSEHLTRTEFADEVIMLGLRRRDGINLVEWRQMFGVDIINVIMREKPSWLEYGSKSFEISPTDKIMSYTDSSLLLTLNGVLIYDYVCKELMSTLEAL